jgi:predicted nucleotidyltransferase
MIDPAVRAEITERLRDVEATEGVRVLFAVESGSRAWGFPSRDSDYDVRFVYVHELDWYLSVDTDSRRDVIERPIIDLIDLSGWELRKALKLFAKSNPPFLEWLGSPIIYRDTPQLARELRALLPAYYASTSSLFHYLHMAKGNHREYLRGETVWVKKYFYILRPLLAVRWIEQGRGPVPMRFTDLLVTIAEHQELVQAIETLRHRKMAGDELDRGPAIPVISEFAARELARLEAQHPDRPSTAPGLEPLNRLFRALVREQSTAT